MSVQIEGNSLGEMVMVPVGAEQGPVDSVTLETDNVAHRAEEKKKKAGRPSNAEKAARAAAEAAVAGNAADEDTPPVAEARTASHNPDDSTVKNLDMRDDPAPQGGNVLGVYLMNEASTVPEPATALSGAFDIRANFKGVSEVTVYTSTNKKSTTAVRDNFGQLAVILQPRSRAMIPTGLIFDIPPGFKLELSARSGLSLKEGLNLANGQALIDEDYTKETFVLIMNNSDLRAEILHGDRIAQAALAAVIPAELRTLDSAPVPKTDRAGGLGSTGVK